MVPSRGVYRGRIRAYILNLDRAPERWAFVQRTFAPTRFEVCRISAVDGNALQFPIREFSERLYRWFHGRPPNPRHVGCYLSHVKALEAFLATDDDHALIAEDDLTLRPDFEQTVNAAMRFSNQWDVLRLSALSQGVPVRVASLGGGSTLNVSFGRLKGTGAYLLNRAAARAWHGGLLPMRLPIDHALDREWFFGLRAAYILPFPASQTESGFRSSIQVGKSLKLSSLQRWVGAYPYQVVHEISRWVFRAAAWLRMRAGIRRLAGAAHQGSKGASDA